MTEPSPPPGAVTPTDAGLWTYRARLVRFVDADTFEVECDTGFGSRHVIHARLAGVNAPERGAAAGVRAVAALAGWMRDAEARVPEETVTWPLRVRTLRRGEGEARSFARWVADVWLVDPEGAWRSVAEWLVANGLAVRA